MSTAAIRLGSTLRRLREQRQRTVEDLAKEAGLAPEVLQSIEDGVVLPSAEVLQRIARACGPLLTTVLDESPQDAGLVTPPRSMFNVGHGKTDQEAQENKRRNKAAQVPYWPMQFPDDLTEAEFEAMMLESLPLMKELAIAVSSILRAVPQRLAPDDFRTTALLTVQEILDGTETLLAVMRNETHNPAEFLLLEQRKGKKTGDYTVTMLVPGDKGYDEALAEIRKRDGGQG